ncbi:hypothetical protein [Mycobacterium deserti]|uniref:Uncharacterized protein n=1 Tax=Mycobacterium deserti TaxID=2978347 RepID=A0ABT2MI78_9MYCO|nr:hypothetical protein [Mycobacterium deserti]MCT7661105.1 hypothetical protein [Mycobacterium deserti]
MTSQITHLVAGPRRHGVVRFGLELQANLRRAGCDVSLCRLLKADALHRTVVTSRNGLHVQFTDRLFGADPAAAGETFSALAADAHIRGARVTATLHDLPQLSDGSNLRRRTLAYRRVTEACDAIVVSSGHERDLLHDSRIEVADVTVIPLPIHVRDLDLPPPRAAGPRSLGVLGFLYPGKGHDDVIAAAADLPSDVEVVAIGTPSAGHDDLVADLRHAAARQGRRFEVTGHIRDSELTKVLQRVTVPIAAHRHVSASGSLNAWLAAGRRPLAPVNRYTAEVVRRNPGTLTLYPDTPAGLRSAVTTALERPEVTWLAADVIAGPSPGHAAAAYLDFFERPRT